jgi:hypothetical protein
MHLTKAVQHYLAWTSILAKCSIPTHHLVCLSSDVYRRSLESTQMKLATLSFTTKDYLGAGLSAGVCSSPEMVNS